MALNIKNEEVEHLAAEVARITGESKTEAIRRALAERRQRLAYRVNAGDRRTRALRFLEDEVWPRIPADQLGRRLTRDEEDEILGYGPEGA
jgi:antitoxin VapB